MLGYRSYRSKPEICWHQHRILPVCLQCLITLDTYQYRSVSVGLICQMEVQEPRNPNTY
ncbi:hypothetical protein JB92DRAFT_3059188 [Gautieria morchelliformis]|nr:hypothetical protein JB92DRAFT_3059188 [Gautieria morchelliformis]